MDVPDGLSEILKRKTLLAGAEDGWKRESTPWLVGGWTTSRVVG